VSNHAQPQPPRATYFVLVAEEDARLDATIAAIRADEDAGHLTPAEAASNRISVLEIHARRVRELREQYLRD